MPGLKVTDIIITHTGAAVIISDIPKTYHSSSVIITMSSISPILCLYNPHSVFGQWVT